jgi:type II secretory pathway predicted ATPase ExeA
MGNSSKNYAELAFGESSKLPVKVKYEAQQHALDFVWSVLGDGQAIGLIAGPAGSGKTTVFGQLVGELPRETAVAVIDGTRIKPRAMISKVLASYGYETDLQTTEELLQLLEMFAAQQARSYQAPILIIDNADTMYPGTLKVLYRLAAMTEQDQPSLRILMASRRRIDAFTDSSGKEALQRPFEVHDLAPMSLNETLIYLYARLERAGVGTPDSIFPGDVCDRLHEMSKGWPGLLNRMAAAAIGAAGGETVTVTKLADKPGKPASQQPPSITVSRDGKKLEEYVFQDRKLLIGRSDFADIIIDDEFSSKFHVLLMLYSDGLVLLDLNSANGTTVNSVRVKSTLLLDDDIISIGHHRLKVSGVPAEDAGTARRATMADTRRMKNLDKLRSKRKAQLKVVQK